MDHKPGIPALSNAPDEINIPAFLQQAVDHYPRLAAFSFTALLPHGGTMADRQSLITHFHTRVGQCIGEYLWQRQQERKNSPPTLLRWIWEAVSAPECKMVLLMNSDTLGAVSNEQLIDNARQAISGIICGAWLTVAGTDRSGVTNITPIIVSRTDKGAFSAPFNQLRTQVQAMCHPVVTAKMGLRINSSRHSR